MTDLTSTLKTYERARQAQIAADRRNKARIFDALTAAGIERVNVTFDGMGDSGQIETVVAASPGGIVDLPEQTLAIERVPFGETKPGSADIPLPEAIEELCYAYLEQEHAGWEINDGSFGEFVFDVEDRRVTLEFEQRYTDSTTYTHEF